MLENNTDENNPILPILEKYHSVSSKEPLLNYRKRYSSLETFSKLSTNSNMNKSQKKYTEYDQISKSDLIFQIEAYNITILNNKDSENETKENIISYPISSLSELQMNLAKANSINTYFIECLKDLPFYSLEALDPYSISCKICLRKKQENYHDLGCFDNFCIDCISLLLINYINSSFVFPDEVLCPVCMKTIPDQIIKKFIPEETYEKMLQLRENLKIQKLVAMKKAIYCPVKDCEGFGHLIPDEKITACNKCKYSLCALCGKTVHPGILCEEFESVEEDLVLNEFYRVNNIKKCPTCGVGVQKIDGCQFIVCHSPLCKGNNALCYLCGRFVIEDQHFSHYKTNGPFGDTCNTLDGLTEEVDSTKLVPIFDFVNPYNPHVINEDE